MAYELVQYPISSDTIEALRSIYVEAHEGDVMGAVIGLLYKRNRYAVHCVGSALRAPTHARGVCLAIDDELRELIHGARHAPDTTL